ncbi:MAG: 4-alpha-glucanotransferase [Geodermatophilaceae bacterium]|nr:4-alpha-glucanotransferase [Geodermatophilaceae bacterium]
MTSEGLSPEKVRSGSAQTRHSPEKVRSADQGTTGSTDGWGIDLRWVDAHEVAWTVGDKTIEALRAAIGRPPADLVEIAPLVVRPGDSLSGLPGVVGPLDVVLEDGSTRQLGEEIPADFPLGYHRVRTFDDGADRRLIVSPGRCWLPEGWRAWGWTVQLYAARSGSSWGFGDLRDLRSIREWAQAAGAGFLLVNPLHAVAPTYPQEPSPYLPASRRFRNPLYLRVEDVPGADAVDLTAVQEFGRALSGLPLIDRDAVWRIKRQALQQIFDAGHTQSGTNWIEALAQWRASAGKPLEEFATWCALADDFGLDFHGWPADLRRPDGSAVARFRAENEPRIAFHSWLQLALEQQLITATAGMTVLQDLPIGVDGGGADAWVWQDQLADGVRIGAPPDLLSTEGQNWGSPPLIPWRMRAAGYDAFIAAIRATMAATGGLRIDHVMGLFRLWWLPAGGAPAEGAYVRYPSADLLNIVALESHRAQAIVVGEDLGTVEPGVREAMAEHAILSYKLLWFEEQAPQRWPSMSMAAVTTHDLPTVAGLWSGADLVEQRRLCTSADESLVAGAAELRTRLRPAGLTDQASPASAVEAAYELLARSPATLLSATLEDAVADERRPNIPGTPNRANWALPMPVRIEDLAGHPTATAIAKTLSAAINDPPTDSRTPCAKPIGTRGP